jgi:hypothetical protein
VSSQCPRLLLNNERAVLVARYVTTAHYHKTKYVGIDDSPLMVYPSHRHTHQAAGSCYRLYPRESYDKLLDNAEPEIKRVSLASVILLLKASGVEDVVGFDYMDKPSKESRKSLL